ncbi:hypothetical protein VTG60DRAFT_3704 [Thermothelomyces hinnuleus]
MSCLPIWGTLRSDVSVATPLRLAHQSVPIGCLAVSIWRVWVVAIVSRYLLASSCFSESSLDDGGSNGSNGETNE